jgi:hypothetical protein
MAFVFASYVLRLHARKQVVDMKNTLGEQIYFLQARPCRKWFSRNSSAECPLLIDVACTHPRPALRHHRACMHAALREVELSLQRPQHFIVDSPLIPQPYQCLSFHLQPCETRITPASVIYQSLCWPSRSAGIASNLVRRLHAKKMWAREIKTL